MTMKTPLARLLATSCVLLVAAVPALAQKAALTQDRDQVARNYYGATTGTQCVVATDECLLAFATVPAGKRLVVTYATGIVRTAAPGQLTYVRLDNQATDSPVYLPALLSPGTDTGRAVYQFSQPVLAVFDAGQAPQIATGWGTPVTSTLGASLRGYLIDYP
jgi:hypothetical protein